MIRLLLGIQSYWLGVAPEGGQRVYYANHQSHMDTVAIVGALPAGERRRVRPLAAADFWDRPMLRLVARWHRAILIERKKVTRTSNPLRPIAEALEAGDSLLVYPEGTRGETEEIGPFKGGIYHIAELKAGLRFVPTLVLNTNRILPKREIFPLPLGAAVFFGPEITLCAGEQKSEFTERCRAALQAIRDQAGHE